MAQDRISNSCWNNKYNFLDQSSYALQRRNSFIELYSHYFGRQLSFSYIDSTIVPILFHHGKEKKAFNPLLNNLFSLQSRLKQQLIESDYKL